MAILICSINRFHTCIMAASIAMTINKFGHACHSHKGVTKPQACPTQKTVFTRDQCASFEFWIIMLKRKSRPKLSFHKKREKQSLQNGTKVMNIG